MLSYTQRRGDSDPADRDNFDAVVTKPVRRVELLTALLGVLGETTERAETKRSLFKLAEALPSARGRVLLVEDNQVNQLVARAMLDKFGVEVDVVGDGAQALEAVAERSYGLVLMDMQMPVLDGIATTRCLRDPSSPHYRPDLPIVALTANAMQKDADDCLAAGMNAFLTKPLVPKALGTALAQWLGRADDGVPPKAL
jgi:CheY-like chemotaxis protein